MSSTMNPTHVQPGYASLVSPLFKSYPVLNDYILGVISNTHFIRFGLHNDPIRDPLRTENTLELVFEYDGPYDRNFNKAFHLSLKENPMSLKENPIPLEMCKDLYEQIQYWYESLPIPRSVSFSKIISTGPIMPTLSSINSATIINTVPSDVSMTPIADTLKDIKEEIESRGDYKINVPKLVDVMFKLGIIEAKED